MEIDGLGYVTDMLYIAKRLYDLGKYELVRENFYDELCYDFYHENMYGLIENIFSQYHCRYSEYRGMELHILSDPVMAGFYKLAGEYGRKVGVPDEKNQYIRAAEEQARSLFSFSYCLDWSLIGHMNPRRPFQSRLGLFISSDDYVDLAELSYGLIELYEWFVEQVAELKKLLEDDSEEAMAA